MIPPATPAIVANKSSHRIKSGQVIRLRRLRFGFKSSLYELEGGTARIVENGAVIQRHALGGRHVVHCDKKTGSGGCRSLFRYPNYMVVRELCRMRQCGVVFSVFEVQILDV